LTSNLTLREAEGQLSTSGLTLLRYHPNWRFTPTSALAKFTVQKNMGMKTTVLISIVILALLRSFVVSAQDGMLDNSFGINGKARFAVTGLVDQNNVFALQADGKMITAGGYNSGSNWDLVVVRLNSDGSPDNSFGVNGKVTSVISANNDVPYGIALQPDGKIIIAGGCKNVDFDAFLVRYNSNGTPDNSFDGDGIVVTDMGGNEAAFGVVLQPDGKIVAGGCTSTGGQLDPAAFRYNSNGTLDNSFDGDGMAVIAGPSTDDYSRGGLALQADGKIVMAGVDNYTSGNFHAELVRLNSNGTPDNSFGVNGLVTFPSLPFALFYTMTIQADGKIIGAGVGATTANPGSAAPLIARFNNNGTQDNSFNGTGYNMYGVGYNGGIIGVTQQSNGKLITNGYARYSDPITAAITYDFAMARYNTNGTLDNAFDGDGVLVVQFGFNVDDGGTALAVQPDGKYLFSGFVFNGTDQDFAVMRVQSDLSTLPISLTNFKAIKKNNIAELSWSTSFEQNNKGFEIQRSNDGVNFNAIGWVDGIGNSSTVNNYSFTDKAPAKGNNFYRFKQIDLDNRIKLSDIQKLVFDATVDLIVFPNPVKNIAQVQLNEDAALIKLTDMNGKELWRKENIKAGILSIPILQWSNGIYVLQVTNSDGRTVAQKIMKQ
jgi:uncharacterized delta-60 repeat protein